MSEMNQKQESKLIIQALYLLELFNLMLDKQFQGRAYENAKNSLMGIDNIRELKQKNLLKNLPGIGEVIYAKICEFLENGEIYALEKLKEQIPIDVLSLIEIPGVGPRTMYKLYLNLGVKTVLELKSACLNGRVAQVNGMSHKTQRKIMNAIDGNTRLKDKSVQTSLF